jgi:hypothetical protein
MSIDRKRINLWESKEDYAPHGKQGIRTYEGTPL